MGGSAEKQSGSRLKVRPAALAGGRVQAEPGKRTPRFPPEHLGHSGAASQWNLGPWTRLQGSETWGEGHGM